MPRLFYTIVLWLVKVRVKVSGREAASEIAALVVTNHVSWTDIPALGALFPAAFVAKSEVGRWPIIRTFARLVNTIFVDRTARRTIPATNAAMLAAIAKGAHVVLVSRGDDACGRAAPVSFGAFRSCRGLAKTGQNYAIQPIAIRYSAPYAPWIGDDALLPHIITLMKNPPLTCELIFCEPLVLSAPLTRRVVAEECFERIDGGLSLLSLDQPALLEQRLGRRRTATERKIGRVRIGAIAGGIDMLFQPRGDLGIENIARLGEGGKAVGIEHFRPEVRVIARRIAVAGEDMGEMRQTVTHRDRLRHPELSELCRARTRRCRDCPPSGALCSARSTSAEAVYSTVRKP